jgi:hypothetical protein
MEDERTVVWIVMPVPPLEGRTGVILFVDAAVSLTMHRQTQDILVVSYPFLESS